MGVRDCEVLSLYTFGVKVFDFDRVLFKFEVHPFSIKFVLFSIMAKFFSEKVTDIRESSCDSPTEVLSSANEYSWNTGV